ncbi:MAG: alpha/beta hydrolase [Chloroflexi bacterium]|nr:MAG: alpha/beta hydrolase [Chloroflexota bacterium]MBL1192837.1 alpha/beta hydrolase [Chloroflexota bacterium]
MPDGRNLAYAEFGDLNGRMVFYFTGGNNSRLEAKSYDATARKLGLRIISIDRPGFGNSDFLPNRQLLDWPEDVAHLADHLEVPRFPVFGLSGGGPHLLALAYKQPERITRGAVVSGAAPYASEDAFKGMWLPIRIMYTLGRWMPMGFNLAMQKAMNNPEQNMQYKDRMRAPDAAILNARPKLVEEFIASVNEAHKNGFEGAAWEWRLYTRPWGFSLEDIQSKIHLWYGEEDGQAPPGMGRYLHKVLPNSRLTVMPNEAHVSLINNHIETILKDLVA